MSRPRRRTGTKGGRRFLAGLFAACLLVAAPGPARADFAAGSQAYDAGDYDEALAQWREAAEAGDTRAQVAIAGLYHFGEGVPQDDAEAARWYRRAARRGNADAQQSLGDFYAEGRGVAQDLVTAHMWLGLAAAQGKAWAERRRREVAARLGLEDRGECERRIRAFMPRENP